jgi:DNA-binding PadR family transcriptional regulator
LSWGVYWYVVVSANEKENESKKEKEKIVTTTKKGAAVLDQWLPDHIKAHYHVLQLVSVTVTIVARTK